MSSDILLSRSSKGSLEPQRREISLEGMPNTSAMIYCLKCLRFRAHYIYPEKWVCYGCSNEISREEMKNE